MVVRDHRIWFVTPQFAWSGISLAIYIGLLLPMIVLTLPNEDPNIKFMKSILPMVALGVGEVAASLTFG